MSQLLFKKIVYYIRIAAFVQTLVALFAAWDLRWAVATLGLACVLEDVVDSATGLSVAPPTAPPPQPAGLVTGSASNPQQGMTAKPV